MAGLTRRRFLELAAAGAAVAALPRAQLAFGGPPGGEWIHGDLHSHTVLSHDVWGGPGDDNTGPDQAYTYGWTAGEQISIAETRGLDFLAITDHDRPDALHLPEYRSDKLVLVPAYEHSLAGGHAGVLMPYPDRLQDIVRDSDGSKSFPDDKALARFLRAVKDRGGIAILNHPFYGNASKGEAIAWAYGEEISSHFDSIEVWNIGWPARHDTIQFADSDDYLSLTWWDREILTRRRVPATGGSDNHWRSTTEAQGVGQPSTWLYVTERSPQGIFDAIRAGRTFIAAEPPSMGGATLELFAREAWSGGRTAMIGDEVRGHGPLDIEVRIKNGSGSHLRLVSSGKEVANDPIVSPDDTRHYRLTLEDPGYLRAELYADANYFMVAMTSPIYSRGRPTQEAVQAQPTGGPQSVPGHPSSSARSSASVTYVDSRGRRRRRKRPKKVARRRHSGCHC